MRGIVLGLSCAAFACGPAAAPSTTDAETTTGATLAASTDEPSPTSTAIASTGEPDPVEPEAACTALCDAKAACWQQPVDPACVQSCLFLLQTGHDPECLPADAALTACLATLSCEILLGDNPSRACDPELRAMLTACRLCNISGGPVDANSCYSDELCPDGLLRIDCDNNTCICTLEGAVTRICPSTGCGLEGFPNTPLTCCRDPLAVARQEPATARP
ncbi:hypothetical protein [Nannocystis sp.]|uniref:hypothetical protein n=1 Tax=Nannocystis sp. TaxID=1962667 RepID=UPI0024251CF5|nr:hypothetical protein [Nannocystis sp.]MBK7827965.1 hypothetical protein [Nannocystis sp.]MBK9752509.1 hypothetical protein [Nannocystis sp.]